MLHMQHRSNPAANPNTFSISSQPATEKATDLDYLVSYPNGGEFRRKSVERVHSSIDPPFTSFVAKLEIQSITDENSLSNR